MAKKQSTAGGDLAQSSKGLKSSASESEVKKGGLWSRWRSRKTSSVEHMQGSEIPNTEIQEQIHASEEDVSRAVGRDVLKPTHGTSSPLREQLEKSVEVKKIAQGDLPKELVEDKARALWMLEGCPEGRDEELWLRAEAELMAASSAG